MCTVSFQPYNPYNNPYLAAALRHYEKKPVYHEKPVYHGPEKKLLGHDYYHYDTRQIPECAYTNKHYYNLTFCLQDDYYPM